MPLSHFVSKPQKALRDLWQRCINAYEIPAIGFVVTLCFFGLIIYLWPMETNKAHQPTASNIKPQKFPTLIIEQNNRRAPLDLPEDAFLSQGMDEQAFQNRINDSIESLDDLIAIYAEPQEPHYGKDIAPKNITPIEIPFIIDKQSASKDEKPSVIDEQDNQENIKPLLQTDVEPRIAIVIDDMGNNRRRTREVYNLPGPLTLAFLPNTRGLKKMTQQASQKGHKLMVHMPMEPMDLEHHNPGQDALRVSLSPEENLKRLRHNLSQFSGYIGFNNHMGSRFTSDEKSFAPIAEEIVSRGLIFLDSRTTANTVAASTVKNLGGRSLTRDIFLDHFDSYDRVLAALKATESKARRLAKTGQCAVAIGHPRTVTIKALRDWLPYTAIKLVTLDECVSPQRTGIESVQQEMSLSAQDQPG